MTLTLPKYTRELIIPEFDEATHTYSLGPSVSRILDALKDKCFYTEESRVFGKAVHTARRYYDEGDLDESTIGDAIRPYLDGWIKFRADTGFTADLIEQPLASDRGFCGTPDGVDYDLAIADLKTGVHEPWHAIQLAMYASMLPNAFISRWAVYLNDRGTYTLKEFPKTEYISDLNVGMNALAIHNWRKRNVR